jgi:recombinational DNA repair protein RecR
MEPLAAAMAQRRRDPDVLGCGNLDTATPRDLPRPGRDASAICVVEDLAIWALERTGAFRGRYHARRLIGARRDRRRISIARLVSASARMRADPGAQRHGTGQTTAHYS